VAIGIPICEDIWAQDEPSRDRRRNPAGAGTVAYWRGKTSNRLNIAVARVVEAGLPIVISTMVGGQDELGVRRRVIRAQRRPLDSGRSFRRSARADVVHGGASDSLGAASTGATAEVVRGEKADYAAVCSPARLRRQNGLAAWCSGSSGRIDSALWRRWRSMRWERSAALRDAAYRFTRKESLDDAARVAKRWLRYDILPIEPAVLGSEAALKPVFAGHKRDRHRRRTCQAARPRHHPEAISTSSA